MARKKSTIVPELTALQAAYVDVRAKGVKQASAAREVGILKVQAHVMEKQPDVAQALLLARASYQEAAKIERQDVVEGIKEAIEVARLRADRGSYNTPVPPGTDVSGVRSVLIWCKQFSHLFAVATLDG